MKEFVADYIKLRKQKVILMLDLINGLFLVIYTLIYSYVFEINIIDYLIGYVVIWSNFILIKFIVKLYNIYGFFNKIEISALFKTNNLYNNIVDNNNCNIVKLKLNKLEGVQKNIFYNYLRDTKKDYNLFKIWDMIFMFLSFAIGASFNEEGLITTQLLSNAMASTLGTILGIIPFYLIFIKIYNSYNKLLNVNIIKEELINYINEFNYNEYKKI